MRFRLVFFLTFFTGLSSAQSQIPQIEITVRDISTYLPIEHVTVTWTASGITRNTVTSRTGKTSIDSLSGDQTVTFKRTGYETFSLTITQILSSGKTIGLNRKIYSFDEVVISAHRHEESKRDLTQQIELIDAKDILKLNRQNTADLLQATGEVMVQKSQAGGGSPVLRGFEANKILLVVDGIRMNNAIYRGGHLQNVLSIDQNMLERTEILFGPGSVMYGSDALGGVVHFRTKNPSFSPDTTNYVLVNAMSRFSSANNEFTAHAGIEAGGTKFASYTGITYSAFGDLTMGSNRSDKYKDFGKRDSIQSLINNTDTTIANPHRNRQTASGYNQLDIIQKLSHKINDRMVQRLNLQLSTSIGDIPRYDRLTEKTAAGIFRFAEWNYGRQDRILAAYEIAENAARKLYSQASVTAAWQKVGESRITRRYGNGWRDSRIEELNIFSVNADFEKKVGEHETRYGFEWNYNDVNSTSSSNNIFTGDNRDIDTRYPAGGSQMNTLAAYLTHTWEISEKTILNAGIRYTATTLKADFGDTAFYKVQTGTVEQSPSAFSGSAGIVHLPSSSSKLSLSLASGFRAPNVDDLAKVFESGSGTVIVPNPDLGPEYTYTAEAGISKSFAEKVFLEAYAWYTLYRDAITVDNYTYNGNDTIIYDGEPSVVKANVNAGEAFLYGGTFIVRASVTKNINLFSAITYTYGRIETDTTDVPLDHIPPVFGRTGIEYLKNKLTLSVWSEYHAKKALEDYNPNGEDNLQYATADGMPAWMTLNIGGSYALNKNIMMQLSVENLLDTHYRVFASGISSAGRNVTVSLRANF